MRKVFIAWLILGILLFSLSVSAAVLTPDQIGQEMGNALKKFGKFLKDFLLGRPNFEDAYFVSFILYFIIFMSLYVEGLKFLPFFGGKGQLSGPGKWFAFAAAMLTSFAIFITENTSTVKESFLRLTAPFGIWGGLVLAAILAFISFIAIRNSELFQDRILFPMAIAAAFGFTTASFILNLGTLLGTGILILIVVMIVGAISGLVHHHRDNRTPDTDTGGGRLPPGETPPELPPRRARRAEAEEQAEESFTIKEVNEIKAVYQNVEALRKAIKARGDKGLPPTTGAAKPGQLNDETIDEFVQELEEKVNSPLNDARRWGRNASRMANRIRRDLRRLGGVIKPETQKSMAICQEIVKEIDTQIQNVGRINSFLKKTKTTTKKMKRVQNYRNAIGSLGELSGKLRKIYEHLGVLFEAEKKIQGHVADLQRAGRVLAGQR